ncbi:N-(5'-phosphoribosyl)anthranilate isomerase [Thermus composti]|uniref:N-(5'-phosphoribosyl)anthranilate isomerase n=1 Tax=Thermus composti TaxID=532059 RepID=A0ABV6Q1D0_9DEIN|nr:phosphoribosylanthranilate isomerase [Thermus composti]GGN05889.1 N-(5'-phosphoribosyl)anthranilate isomerase [Thermus composti]
MRVKVCGITRLEDALLAEELGAYALGFVLAPGSKRRILPEAARRISEALGPFVVRVGVFRDQPPGEVLRLMERARLQVAQLHGEEPPEWALAVGRFFPVIKAFALEGPAKAAWADYPAWALLLDGKLPGSGKPYPREWAQPLLKTGKRVILAGGITPENLGEVLALRPYALDLASGVEAAPGVKDPEKLRALFARLRGL